MFLLETPPYHYGSQAAGLFGLVGAAGAAGAPLVGRFSDKHGPRFAVGASLLAVFASYVVLWGTGKTLAGLIVGVLADGHGSASRPRRQSNPHLQPRARRPQPPQHVLHGLLFRRRRRRLVAGRIRVAHARLARRLRILPRVCHCARAFGATRPRSPWDRQRPMTRAVL